MIEVKFSKQWRGHNPDTIVTLTDERAKQLISEGYCVSTVEPEKKRRGRPAKVVETESAVEPSAPPSAPVFKRPETISESLKTEP
ncbi:MAG: hypothetical protein E4G91_11305 [Candidatus Zixiibacteriota bacterium]|nr:MAG: hypothetical protein E4G91_11305 [candidate division Zixibacteria bacterium]